MKVQLFLPVSAGVHVLCCSFQLGGYDHWSAAFDFASLREGEGEGEDGEEDGGEGGGGVC